jgi:hypothetical protein
MGKFGEPFNLDRDNFEKRKAFVWVIPIKL